MKKSINRPFESLTKNELNNLTTVVKETIALNLVNNGSKVFTTVDLWNMQRHTKTRTQRRFL